MAPSTLYAVASNNTFKSTDGGGSWNVISGIVRVRLLVIDPTNSSTIYAGTFPNYADTFRVPFYSILKSTDGGESWNAINTGLPPDTFILALAIDPMMPSTVYAAGNGIFRSTDGGGSWKEIDWSNIRWFTGNVIITLFAFPLIFIFEKIFGFTSARFATCNEC